MVVRLLVPGATALLQTGQAVESSSLKNQAALCYAGAPKVYLILEKASKMAFPSDFVRMRLRSNRRHVGVNVNSCGLVGTDSQNANDACSAIVADELMD